MPAPTRLNPYIGFKDTTKQAMEFYQAIFGGKLDISTFGEFSQTNGGEPMGRPELIMHAQLETEDGMVLMASDTPEGMEYKPGTNISISLSGNNETELSEYYRQLAEGGVQTMPLADSPWGDKFGMVTDKFGVSWMVNIAKS